MAKTKQNIFPGFAKLLELSEKENTFKERSDNPLDWFRKKVTKQNQKFKIEYLKQTRPGLVRNIKPWEVGQIFTFQYSPKGKDTLPYYDVFPMVLIIGQAPGGFLGLNFHYLPHTYRAFLFSQLSKLVVIDKTRDIEKIRVNYQILQSLNRFAAFRPTLKKYLINNIRRNFLQIFPQEWEVALFLPIPGFVKSTQEQVWKDSIAKIK
jgi:hypothetical protein